MKDNHTPGDVILRNKLGEVAHSQWSGWMEYLFSKGELKDDGTWVMPSWAVQRWSKQMTTPFSELSDTEQESDREEADKFLVLFKAESDLLGECLGALRLLLICSEALSCSDCEINCSTDDDDKDNPQAKAKAILAKRKGEL